MGGVGKEAERRRRVFDHAKQTGNVAKTCRYFGIGRKHAVPDPGAPDFQVREAGATAGFAFRIDGSGVAGFIEHFHLQAVDARR